MCVGFFGEFNELDPIPALSLQQTVSSKRCCRCCFKFVISTFPPSQAYMGSGWFDTLALCTAAHNFPFDKGLALGLTKSLYGLSASLLTTAYENLFVPSDVTRFLGFLAILVPAVGAGFAMVVARVADPALLLPLTRAESFKFAGGYIGVLSIAGYVGKSAGGHAMYGGSFAGYAARGGCNEVHTLYVGLRLPHQAYNLPSRLRRCWHLALLWRHWSRACPRLRPHPARTPAAAAGSTAAWTRAKRCVCAGEWLINLHIHVWRGSPAQCHCSDSPSSLLPAQTQPGGVTATAAHC